MAEIDNLYDQFFVQESRPLPNEFIDEKIEINRLLEQELNMEGDNIELEIEEPFEEERKIKEKELKKSLNPNLKLFNFSQLKDLFEYLKQFNKQDLIIYQFYEKAIDYTFLEFKGIIIQLKDKQIKWSWEYLDLIKSGLTSNLPIVEHIYNFYWEDNPFLPFILYIYADLIDFSKINLNENTLGLPVLINKYNEIENREVFLAIYHNFIDFPLVSNFSLFFSWSLNQFILWNIKWKPFAIYGQLIPGYLIYKESDIYTIVSPDGQKFNLPNSYSVKKKEFIKINRKPKEYLFQDIQLNNSNNEQILIKLNGIEFDSFTMSFWKSRIKYLINGDDNGLLVFNIPEISTIDNIINYLESYQTGKPKINRNFSIETYEEKPMHLFDTIILLKIILVTIFTSKKEPLDNYINVTYQIDGNDYNKQLTLISNLSCNGLILMENCFQFNEKTYYPHQGLYNWFKKWIEQRNINLPIFFLRKLEMTEKSETEINSIHSRINNIGFLNIINYPNKKIIRICATFPRNNEVEYRKLLLSLLIS